jgi:hypothetical protein
MIEDHEQIDELLAGYALQSLEGDDAREADRVLSEHVPSCDRCKATLRDFQALAGDLALATAPVEPPDLLLPRLRSQLGETPVKRRRSVAVWLSAAAMVAVIALASWNVLLNTQASNAVASRANLQNALTGMLNQDGSQMVTLKNDAQKPTMLAAYQPGQAHAQVVGLSVPQPAPGDVYELWLVKGGQAYPMVLFTPAGDGVVRLNLDSDLSAYDQIVVTEQQANIPAPAPSGQTRWIAYING